MKRLLLILSLMSFACEKSMEPVNLGFSGITETNETGDIIGETDPDDWGYFPIEEERNPLYFGNSTELNYDQMILFSVFDYYDISTRKLILTNHSQKTKHFSFRAASYHHTQYEYSLEKRTMDLNPGQSDTLEINYSVSDTMDLDFPANELLKIIDENREIKTIELSGAFDTFYVMATSIPEKSIFFPAFPNPATKEIIFRYKLQRSSNVTLEIYAMENYVYKILFSDYIRSQNNIFTWDVSDVPEGIYRAVLTINDQKVQGDIQVIK